MKRRSLSLVLLAATLLATSCGTGGNNDTDETTAKASDTAAAETTDALFVSDSLPDGLDFKGDTVKICVQSNRVLQYDVGEATGDIVNDAIYQARRDVEERLKLKIEYIPYTYASWNDRDAYMNQIGASILADSNDFDVLASSSFISQFMLTGYLTDMSGMPYIDFDKPWWSSNMIENVTIDGVTPFITGDISIGGIKSMMCMFMNKKLAGNFGIDNIYDTVRSGGWTLDKLGEYVELGYSDLNGNATVDEADAFGLVLEGSNYATGFFDACGMEVFDTSSGFKFTFDNEHCTNVVQRLCALLHNNDGAIIRGKDDSANYLAEDTLFRDGNTLFTGGWISCAESYRDLDFDYAILPYPKYDENQESHKTTVLNTYTNFAIPVICREIEASCAALEALSSEFYRSVTPSYFEIALKVKYARDDETSEMFDLIRENAGYSFGMVMTNIFDLVDTNFKNALNNNNSDWASTMSSKKNSVMAKTGDVLAVYKEMGSR